MIPLDAHAHVPLSVSTRELSSYAPSLILAMTGSPAMWPAASRRRDVQVAWGLGCHPGDATALRDFDESQFARAAAEAPFIGEVGLDARSSAPTDLQARVFASVLRVAEVEGLLVSVHSVGRATQVLEVIERFPGANVVLHWWTGTAEETTRAIGLGCYFSINGAARAHILRMLPRDRVLPETDFPFTRSTDRAAIAPGRVARPIALLAAEWQESPEQVLDHAWAALASIDRAGRLQVRAKSFAAAIAAMRLRVRDRA